VNQDVKTLGELPFWEWPPDGIEIVERALASADPDDRLAATELSHVLMDDALADTMLRMITEDPSVEVRAAAATALGPALEEADIYEIDADTDCALSREAFERVRRALKRLYHDAREPDLVRRRVLEASVRSRMSWHAGAVRGAWLSDSDAWRTTAVFCMGFVPDFEDTILEALESDDPALRFEAVRAAGLREIERAGKRIVAILRNEDEDNDVKLVGIEALPRIDPSLALRVLPPFARSTDPELAELAELALREAAMWQSLDDEGLDGFAPEAFGAGFDFDVPGGEVPLVALDGQHDSDDIDLDGIDDLG